MPLRRTTALYFPNQRSRRVVTENLFFDCHSSSADSPSAGVPMPSPSCCFSASPVGMQNLCWRSGYRRTWWAIQPLKRPAIQPPPLDPGWTAHPIDRFIAAKHAENDLRPSPPADRQSFIRRAKFNLTGLPPTRGSQRLRQRQLHRCNPAVDRPTAFGPRYGERWARHWMDVAHYAETHGHDEDAIRENAWPYRDWLIESFNNDKPARIHARAGCRRCAFPGRPAATGGIGF